MSSLLEFLLRFDGATLERLKVVIDLLRQIAAEESTAGKVRLVLQLLKKLAEISPTSVDDEILGVIDRFASEELIDRLLGLIERYRGASTVMSAESVKNEAEFYSAQGLSLLQVIALARMVKQVIDMIQAGRVS